jgi:glycosyltransferase involved in cell wall biosynthesis
MSDRPDVSVVMSVYNGASYLGESVRSILAQQGVALELIIVNDGSTDESGRQLAEYARTDSRVRLINQHNQGLTRALIRGCAQARGQYIARQDVGDTSLPGRLIKQLDCISQNTDASLVSCGTRFVGPGGESLYEINQSPVEATSRLLATKLSQVRGPSHHGSAMFRRALYERAGGYRAEFYFGQDLDLWIRLAELGPHVVMAETLYEASVTVGAISSLYRREQVETAKAIIEGALLRRGGLSEAPALRKAQAIKPSAKRGQTRRERSRALYFIGTCLKKGRDPKASSYFKEALRANPLHLKSAVRLILG